MVYVYDYIPRTVYEGKPLLWDISANLLLHLWATKEREISETIQKQQI